MLDLGYIFMMQSGTVTTICNSVALEFLISITFHRQPYEVLPPIILRRFACVWDQATCVLPHVFISCLVRLVLHVHVSVCRRVVLPYDDTPHDRVCLCIILPYGSCLN